MRDDIEIYLRNQGHRENVLIDYWPIHYQLRYLGLRNPLAILDAVEAKLLSDTTANQILVQKLVSNIFKSMGLDNGENPPD
jgi:hypothetical protein